MAIDIKRQQLLPISTNTGKKWFVLVWLITSHYGPSYTGQLGFELPIKIRLHSSLGFLPLSHKQSGQTTQINIPTTICSLNYGRFVLINASFIEPTLIMAVQPTSWQLMPTCIFLIHNYFSPTPPSQQSVNASIYSSRHTRFLKLRSYLTLHFLKPIFFSNSFSIIFHGMHNFSNQFCHIKQNLYVVCLLLII